MRICTLATLIATVMAGTAYSQQATRIAIPVIEQPAGKYPAVHTSIRVSNASTEMVTFFVVSADTYPTTLWEIYLPPEYSYAVPSFPISNPTGQMPVIIYTSCHSCDLGLVNLEAQIWSEAGWICKAQPIYQAAYGYTQFHTISYPWSRGGNKRLVIWGPHAGVKVYDGNGRQIQTIPQLEIVDTLTTYLLPDATAYAVVTQAVWDKGTPQPVAFYWGVFNLSNGVEILP